MTSAPINMILVTAVQSEFRWHWDQLPSTLRSRLGKTDVFHAVPISSQASPWAILKNIYRLLRLLRGYDIVLFHGHTFASLLIPALRELRLLRTPFIALVEFNLSQDDGSLRSKIKYALLRILYANTDLVFPFSRTQADYLCRKLHWRPERVLPIFQPSGYGPVSTYLTPRYDPGEYILAVGRTGRDYHTFCKAIQGIEDEVVIVTDPKSVHGIQFAKNVHIEFNVSLPKFIDIMANSRYVVIPLKNTINPTGLRTLFMAMQLGKASIVTGTRSLREYFPPGDCPILIVPPEDAAALRQAIHELNRDPRRVKKLGQAARAFIEKNFTSQGYVTQVMEAILTRYHATRPIPSPIRPMEKTAHANKRK